MNKFFIMTRGRTGSTAIIDELSKVKGVLAAAHEPFIKMNFRDLLREHPTLIEQYGVIVPFELWKTKYSQGERFLRSLFFQKMLITEYLNEVEAAGMKQGALAVGYKVLSNQFKEKRSLKHVLRERGYRVIYLQRNIPRQVISGMIAKERGVYNTNKKYEDDRRYHINLAKFKELVDWEIDEVKKDLLFLRLAGFNYIDVTYEEFMTDRRGFFDRVLEFLAVPAEQPQASSYSVMIKDLQYTVVNYQAVVDCADAMGMRIE